jgi:CDP-diacylglycerol--glycerol-3-phosphate 3-phosphatidyltransferase
MMMLTLYAVKPGFQRLLRPTARFLVSIGVTPNQVTISTCLLSVAVAIMLILYPSPRLLLSLPLFLLVRMALNAIDGIMAKEFGLQSALGIYLNELGDVVSDSVLYASFALLGIFDPLWMFIIIVLSVISEMAGTVAVMAGASRRYDGPMGKSDRALIFGGVGLWLGLGNSMPQWAGDWLPPCIALYVVVTIVNRIKKGLREYAHTN